MSFAVGVGTDVHRLEPGSGIPLGGVVVPCDKACVAVSDGDVLLHALTDALLGGMGQGDIGERYPESKVGKGESSRRFVEETMLLLEARGGRVVNVDCTVDLERPRLASWKMRIRDSVAALLRVSPGKVNIKAKTAEGLGSVGNGEAVSAQVVALLELPDAS